MKIADFNFDIGEEACALDCTFFEKDEFFIGSKQSYRFHCINFIVSGYQIEADTRYIIDTDGNFFLEKDVFVSEYEALEEFKRRVIQYGLNKD